MNGKKIANTALSVTTRTFLFVVILVALYFVGTTSYEFGRDVFHETSMSSESKALELTVVIPEDLSNWELAQLLKSEGLVSDEKVFYVQILLSDYKDKYVAGEYILSTDMTPTQILSGISPTTEESTEE